MFLKKFDMVMKTYMYTSKHLIAPAPIILVDEYSMPAKEL